MCKIEHSIKYRYRPEQKKYTFFHYRFLVPSAWYVLTCITQSAVVTFIVPYDNNVFNVTMRFIIIIIIHFVHRVYYEL